MAFLPRNSDLPLQVAFPVLIANLTGELMGGAAAPTDALRPATRSALPFPRAPRRSRSRDPTAVVELAPATADAATVGIQPDGRAGRVHGRPGVRSRDAAPAARPTPIGDRDARLLAASLAPAGPSSTPVPTAPPVDPNAPVRFAVDLFDVNESDIAPGSPARSRRSAGNPACQPRRVRQPVPARRRPPRRGRPGSRAAGRAEPPAARDELWVLVVLVVLVVLLVEWLVYHRDAVTRLWRGVRRGPAASPVREGRALMGIRFEAPIWLLLLVPALVHHLRAASRRPTAHGRAPPPHRAGDPDDPAVGAGVGARWIPARAAGRSACHRVRRRPVRQRRRERPPGRPGVPARDASTAMPEGDQAGIVAFGKDALVERLPEELREIDRIRSTPVKAATDVGARAPARRRALPRCRAEADRPDLRRQRHHGPRPARGGARGGARHPGRDADDRARRSARRCCRAAHDALDGPTRRGDRGDRGRSRRASRNRRPFACSLTAALVDRRRRPQGGRQSRWSSGSSPTEAGFHTFRAVVEAASDTFSQNDRADSNTIVKGEPRILVLAGNQAVAAELVKALKAEGQLVDSIVPEALPTDFSCLLTYDSVVVVDVPRLRFTDKQLVALQTYVRDLGRGLVNPSNR